MAPSLSHGAYYLLQQWSGGPQRFKTSHRALTFLLLAAFSPHNVACACVLSCSCLTLCDQMDCGLPGSSIHGILQARILERVAMPSFRGSSQPRDRTCVSCGSCIAGGFFTAEPSGKPSYMYICMCFMYKYVLVLDNHKLINMRELTVPPRAKHLKLFGETASINLTVSGLASLAEV